MSGQSIQIEAPPQQQEKPQAHKPKPRCLPPHAVIVLNDNDHTFLYVIEVLRRICQCNLADAEELTWKIHHHGKAMVWTGSKEVAELKRDQIRGYGPDFYASLPVRFPLGVRIELMPGG